MQNNTQAQEQTEAPELTAIIGMSKISLPDRKQAREGLNNLPDCVKTFLNIRYAKGTLMYAEQIKEDTIGVYNYAHNLLTAYMTQPTYTEQPQQQ